MKQSIYNTGLAMLALLFAGCASPGAKPMPKAQTPQLFTKTVTQKLTTKYLLYLPPDYDAGGRKRWPLMLFLHGAGERGTNLNKVAVHGPPKLIKQGTNFPFIVVSPQCPDDESWSTETLLGLLDEITAKYRVDTNRVYLTGLSMGGFGTWKLGVLYPERFAAIAPICGGGDIINVLLTSKRKTEAMKSLGVWAFHGGKDPVVPVGESERMIAALKRANCTDVKLTIYPDAQHDSWSESYQNPELYEWFLAHQRGK